MAYLMDYLRRYYPDSLVNRYGLPPDVLAQTDPMLIVEAIGIQRKMLLKEGEIDIDRALQLILKDFKGGLLGRVSLERP